MILILAFCFLACKERVSDPKVYLERAGLPEAGLFLVSSRGAIRYELVQREEAYFLALALSERLGSAAGQPLDSLVAETHKRYGNGIFFVFTVRANPSQGDGDFQNMFSKYQESFVQNPFGFMDAAILVSSTNDTVHCDIAEPTMDRLSGFSASVFLGFSDPGGKAELGRMKLMIRDRGFWTELIEFDLAGIQPRLKFVPKRNVLDA